MNCNERIVPGRVIAIFPTIRDRGIAQHIIDGARRAGEPELTIVEWIPDWKGMGFCAAIVAVPAGEEFDWANRLGDQPAVPAAGILPIEPKHTGHVR